MSSSQWVSRNDAVLNDSQSLMFDYVLIRPSDIGKLALYINNPTAYTSGLDDKLSQLWSGGNANGWLSTLIYFPFDIKFWATQDNDPTYNKNYALALVKPFALNDDPTYTTEVDCKKINPLYCCYLSLGEHYVAPNYNNFADYNGYTSIQVYLPFFGFIEISPNDVMGKYLQFRLQIDYRTGSAQYYIGVSDNSIGYVTEGIPFFAVDNFRLLSTHSFQLGTSIPIGSRNTTEYIRNTIMGAIKTTGDVVSTIATAATSSPTPSMTTKKTVWTKRNKSTGRQIITATKTEGKIKENFVDPVDSLGNNIAQEVFDNSLSAIINMHYNVSSDISNNIMVNSCGSRRVQVVYKKPKFKAVDENYNHLYGKPLGEVRQISTLRGYTEISKVHFEGAGFAACTSLEYALIEKAFGEGVLLPE